jgi:serine/threonine-protein kinase
LVRASEQRALQTIERADTELSVAPAADTADRESGVQPIVQLGPYRILELIGSGAMGEVYKAEHVLLGRKVAIKTLRRELAGSRSFAQRMFAEARASNLVGNEHIVQVLDLACEPDGTTWFAMELLEGASLASLCDRQDVSIDRALDLARQVCEALIPVHDAGIVHRDIKPENIFVVDRDGDDFVKLLDFGIARMPEREEQPGTRSGIEVVIGTPPYMAPEQVFGGKFDARTDLYAVGALMFELLTGRQLFQRESMTELLGAVVLAEPPVPSEHVQLPAAVRAQIDCVVARCLAKEPEQRPTNARELAGELAAIAFCLEDAREAAALFERAQQEAQAEAQPQLPESADELIAIDALLDQLPSHQPRALRRAPAIAACALAVATWLVPASGHQVALEPTLQRVGGWVTGLLTNPPWRSTARAEAAFDASAPAE